MDEIRGAVDMADELAADGEPQTILLAILLVVDFA